ncbi:MAG TPA: alpha/beta hydrolase [Methylovirgula sp.]|nr:alpha/beta hydrolase [Methylovirgula sp.]
MKRRSDLAKCGALLAIILIGWAGAALAAGCRLRLVSFATSPFPYDGIVPESGKPFLDTMDGTRRGHTSPRGGIYWEDETYSDRHVLLAIPPQFNPRRPAFLIVFLHGNKVLLARDVVARQRVPEQLVESRLNAVLVAPQFAVDALDSSAGTFWEPHRFAQFLDEAAEHLARLYGNRRSRAFFYRMPVVIVAYSGGYMPASAALSVGGADGRLAGVVLLDALYGESDTFADWIAKRQGFFFSAYSLSSAAENASLQQKLEAANIDFVSGLPRSLRRGSIAFLAVGDVPHQDFVTQAWTTDPLAAVLRKLKPGS